jgi:hypothetical protein
MANCQLIEGDISTMGRGRPISGVERPAALGVESRQSPTAELERQTIAR